MDQPILNSSQNAQQVDTNTLILSSPQANAFANLPPDMELTTVRQMMQTLFARVESLQQNQAVQLAGVHDRLDAVELELPLIQEQGALRIRDLEARVSVEIDQAARLAVEEATSAATRTATAVFHEHVAGKFDSFAAQMEAQRNELSQMRESKKLADSRLSRAIVDIERLCGNLGTRPEEEPLRARVEPPVTSYRSRISEHIRKAAINLAPNVDNPLTGHPPLKGEPVAANPAPAARATAAAAFEKPVSVDPRLARPAAQAVVSRVVNNPAFSPIQDLKPDPASVPSGEAKPASPGNPVPGFDDWKRQFMQNGDPAVPALGPEHEPSGSLVICPRCYSDRTRPATLTRLDHLYRLARLTPHRCRSCSHRFYKRAGQAAAVMASHDESTDPGTTEAMETR